MKEEELSEGAKEPVQESHSSSLGREKHIWWGEGSEQRSEEGSAQDEVKIDDNVQ